MDATFSVNLPASWTFKHAHIPIQRYSSDCGVFVCKFAQIFIREQLSYNFLSRDCEFFRKQIGQPKRAVKITIFLSQYWLLMHPSRYKTFEFKLKREKPFIASILNFYLSFLIRVTRFLYEIEGKNKFYRTDTPISRFCLSEFAFRWIIFNLKK